jgi:hypothetical protein
MRYLPLTVGKIEVLSAFPLASDALWMRFFMHFAGGWLAEDHLPICRLVIDSQGSAGRPE